jgi:hypothetical protein
MVPSARKQMAATVGAAAAKAPSCASVLGALAAGYPPQLRSALERVRVYRVRVGPTRGFAYFTMPGESKGLFPVVRAAGRWYVGALSGSSL